MFHHSWPMNQDLWVLYHKVTFDGPNKLIIVNSSEADISIEEDVYSDWKEWAIERDHLKFDAALRTVGGDPTQGGDFLGATFFTINGWQIQINDNVVFDGNIYSDDFDTPYATAAGVVLAQSKFSNLVDKIAVNTDDLISAGIATTGTITTQTTTLQTTLPTGVVNELNNTAYDGVLFGDIMEIVLAMAQGRIVESATGVFEFYSQNNTDILYTMTKSGNEVNRS